MKRLTSFLLAFVLLLSFNSTAFADEGSSQPIIKQIYGGGTKTETKVEAAVNAVIRDKSITDQAQVDAMAAAIEVAIASLERNTQSPQTGDNSHTDIWLSLLIINGCAILVVTIYSIKKKLEKTE